VFLTALLSQLSAHLVKPPLEVALEVITLASSPFISWRWYIFSSMVPALTLRFHGAFVAWLTGVPRSTHHASQRLTPDRISHMQMPSCRPHTPWHTSNMERKVLETMPMWRAWRTQCVITWQVPVTRIPNHDLG